MPWGRGGGATFSSSSGSGSREKTRSSASRTIWLWLTCRRRAAARSSASWSERSAKLALGNRRAEQIRQFLVGFGLAQDRFEIVSFGEGRPLQQGSNEAAWARNRRGQFVITAGANAINPGN